MKRLLSVFIAVIMAVSFAAPALADGVSSAGQTKGVQYIASSVSTSDTLIGEWRQEYEYMGEIIYANMLIESNNTYSKRMFHDEALWSEEEGTWTFDNGTLKTVCTKQPYRSTWATYKVGDRYDYKLESGKLCNGGQALERVNGTNVDSYGHGEITIGHITYTEYGTYCELSSCDTGAEGKIYVPLNVEFNGSFLPVKEIRGAAFFECTKITKAVISKNVTTIGGDAFNGCSMLQSVSLPEGLTVISNGTFFRCSSLESITIPTSVTTIEDYSFRCCSSIKKINIPENVTKISEGAFSECTSVESITISNKNTAFYCVDNCLIEVISRTLLAGCKNSVIPDDGSVKAIGEGAFDECDCFTELVIPDGVTRIGVGAFFGCASIETVTLPESLTLIENTAFFGCDNLKNVVYQGSEEMWNRIDINDGNDCIKNLNIIFDNIEIILNTTRLKDLTGVDYLAFAALAYEDPKGSIGKTVGDFIGKKLRSTYENTDYNYGNLCENIIYWTVFDYEETNEDTGFTAITFTNGQEYVITFEGSNGEGPLAFNNTDAFKDWWINDFPAYSGRLTSQVSQAINYYGKIIKEAGNNKSKIHLTGHSLGGGLADIVSAYTDSYAETFNAAPFVGVAYSNLPNYMSILFTGVDEWNFYDHVNLEDYFIGSWAYTYKNCMLHKNEGYTDDNPSIISPHKLKTFIKKKDGNSEIKLTDFKVYKTSESVERKQVPLADKPSANRFKDEYSKNSRWKGMFSSGLAFFTEAYTLTDTLKYLYLGDTKDNAKSAGYWSSWVFFGGDGYDAFDASKAGGKCKFVGGKGDDYLTGSKKDDVYYYYYEKNDNHNGDGYDTISDKSGKADIYLMNCNKDDDVGITEDNNYFYININSNKIIRIVKGNRSDNINVYVYDSGFKKIDETSVKFKKKLFKTSYTIACPVNVVIYDTDGQPVYEIPDNAGCFVNEYGAFIVYEKDGDMVREFDLADDYYPVITGYDDGTMNVYVEKDGEEAVFGAIDIPVSNTMTAELKEDESGDMILRVDNDSDDKTDKTLTLTDAVATVKITTDYEKLSSKYEGIKALIGETIQIDANLDLESDFIGWYENGELISENTTLEYDVKGDTEIKAVYDVNEDETNPDEPEPVNVKPGDCNGDGMIDNKDVVVLFRYVSGTEKAEDESIYDFNGDGKVDNKDVVALFRFVSGTDSQSDTKPDIPDTKPEETKPEETEPEETEPAETEPSAPDKKLTGYYYDCIDFIGITEDEIDPDTLAGLLISDKNKRSDNEIRIKEGDDLHILGWVIIDGGIDRIECVINNTETIKCEDNFIAREELAEAYGLTGAVSDGTFDRAGFGQNDRFMKIDLSRLEKGTYTLSLIAVGVDGTRQTLQDTAGYHHAPEWTLIVE